MDNTLCRREVARPRRHSAAAADSGASVSLQDGEPTEMHSPRESQTVLDRLSAAGGFMDRRNSAPLIVHKRHMPKEPNKFHIPRKAKEKRALFQYVSTESREFEDMMNILTSNYFDPGSAGCFTYSKPCLVHSELQEKEFVEKRREMKADGRTEKELEENYCFYLADALRLPPLCENGLCVGQTWLTVLGNPHKGVYLSKYSDLLQVSLFAPGATGEIIIFKVMKGKVKSIYENVKNLLDPTPRFDSHIFKNASKVTSLASFRAFEFTQQYFYEYSFDELRQRPRQVCPYAVVSFQFKGKDTILPRLNSQPSEGSKVQAQFTVWTGDLVKGDRVLCQISLRSFSPPFLPHRLPEKLDIGRVMKLDQVTMLLPSGLFSYNQYNSSKEVVENGHYCRLLEVIDRGRSSSTMTKLLQEMETKRVVLVTPLSEKGFLFLLSSVQMATPSERGENWKRCLQALFVFPETRDLAKSTSRCASSSPHDASESQLSGAKVMPHLSLFIPALHHALVKARANPSPELSAGVERQTKEYLIGLKDGKVRQYPMGEYDSKQDEQEKVFPMPKHHQVNMTSYLRSYLANRALYLLSVARARQVVETNCGPEEPQQVKPKNSCGGQRESVGKEVTSTTRDGETNSQKMQQLLDLVLTCKRNAENEVKKEEGREGGLRAVGRKRRLEQKTAVRALKYLKASQGPAGHDKIPVEGSQPASPDSLTSVIASVGLRDSHLREDGSELSAKLLSLLKGLSRAARGSSSQEEEQRESCPFERLATKLGLPTNCDIDLRKQEELEEQTAGSVSSLEGFSPSSHSGEMSLHRAAGGRGGRGVGGYEDEEEWEIPWVLIPITGLCSKRLSPKDRLIPQDPRFRHLAATTHIATATKPSRKSPTQSPVPSPPPSPFQCLSPEPSPPLSPSQCPSPDPSPPLSPSQCPSPDTSPPFSPSQCPSPEPSPCSSPLRCPSPQPSPSMFPSHFTSPHLRLSPSPSQCQSLGSVEFKPFDKGNNGANDENFPPTTSREFTGMSKDKRENPQEKEKKSQEPSFFTHVQPSIPQAAVKSTSPSSLPFANRRQYAQKEVRKVKEEDAVLLEEKKDNQPIEKVKQLKEEGVSWYELDEESVVNMAQETTHEKQHKGKGNELMSGSLVSPSLSSPPAHPLRDIDSIVDKHIGNFFTEMQHLLQEESIHCSFPQSPHSTLNTANLPPQHTLQPGLAAQFSHYVSLYNPCPPVQDYVSSLQDSINTMITEFGDNCHHQNADTSQSGSDSVLASSVGAFVASIRAANTNTSDKVCAPCSDPTAADDTFSVCQTPALSRGGEVLQADATSNRKSPALNIIVTVPTSASDLHPPSHKLPQSHWNSQQSNTLENKRTVVYNVRQTQDSSFTKTMDCVSDAEGGSSPAGSNTGGLGSSIDSKPLAEASHSPQQESTSASGSGPAPPATALSSLINQLEPEVFNSLVKIIKDVKKNSLQFYLHSTETRDHVFDNVKAYLVKQGNVDKSPVTFLNQDNADNRLLVIIKNKDIAGHIHKIPCLVSLKRRPSVLFVGIDTLDDIRNNSYNELFVSGGCIVSDELILNPDFITYDQLTELLKLLEQHSSLESVWKWKVHCKTHKKLKEQARFRRDSAKILDLLSAYQKKQIVEFLPYHHCDMMNHQSPDLECLTELQARYTQFRHTVFLTDRFLKKSPEYLSGGIIVGGIDEILSNFTRMVGYHNVKDRQPVLDALLATKGLDRQLSHGDSASGSERSPSIFPEHIHPLSSSEQHQHVLQQPSSSFLPHPHLSDQLVPDASCKDVGPQPSDTDFEVLRLAISQLRAERQAQLQQQQQLDSQLESTINCPQSFLSIPVSRGSNHTPLIGQGGSSESSQGTPGRKAIAATLELIHSTLQPEQVEGEWRQDRGELPTVGLRKGGQGEGGSQDRVLTLLEENQDLVSNDSSTSSYNENTATVTGPGDLMDKTNTEREKAAQLEKSTFVQSTKVSAATSSTSSCPAEGDRSGGVKSEQERPIRGEGTPVNGSNKVTGSITMVTGQEDSPNPALPQLHQIQQSQYHLQQFTNQQHEFQPSLTHSQLPPHSQQQQQQQWGHGYMRHHHLPHYPGQPFPAGPMVRPLTALDSGRGLLGPTPAWPGDLSPAGAANMVWSLPQAVSGPALLGMYHKSSGQGSNMYRGGQRGGFNGM